MTYRTVLRSRSIEIEIKKSRFIGHAMPAQSAEDAEEFIREIKQEHNQATHNCTAYIVGESSIQQRYSDDGEPQGTAGIPMLELLRKEELTNTLLVVTRYFGGIKLGAAGLVRAYTQASKEAIEEAKIVRYFPFTRVRLTVDYADLGRLDYYCQTEGLYESSRVFEDRVILDWLLADDRLEEVQGAVLNMTRGTGDWSVGPGLYLPVDSKDQIIEVDPVSINND